MRVRFLDDRLMRLGVAGQQHQIRGLLISLNQCEKRRLHVVISGCDLLDSRLRVLHQRLVSLDQRFHYVRVGRLHQLLRKALNFRH